MPKPAVSSRGAWAVVAAAAGLLAWPLDPAAGAVVQGIVLVLGVLLVLAPGLRVPRSLALGALALLALVQRPGDPLAGLGVLVATAALLLRASRPDRRPVSLATALGLAALVLALPAALPLPSRAVVGALGGLSALLTAAQAARGRAPGLAAAWAFIMATPARILVSVFAALSLGGTLLLSLPAAARAPGGIAVVDALFTAVSAVCVTGLIVLDTPVDLTVFGQAVVLVLIQLGGLGMMAFAALALLTLGRRLGLRHERLTAELLGGGDVRRNLESALAQVLGVTFAAELAGALGLAAAFVSLGDAPATALWRGLFTAVSAFCNAGFALQSDSLVPYQQRPDVLGIVGLLIVLGGTGPLVVTALLRRLRRGRRARLGLHARLVLSTTALLVFVPALLFVVVEWHGVLRGLSPVHKLSNALFQSVTLRTAGFNSVDFGTIAPATWTLSLVCMFIGASPGSTGGGAKTTTVAVALLSVLATVRGRDGVAVFGRRVGPERVREAVAIVAVGACAVLGATLVLQLTQDIPLDRVIFEVVSALATAGLSMGATAQLDLVGKLAVAALMFAGRIGPLTLFIFLLGQDRTPERHPTEPVQVG